MVIALIGRFHEMRQQLYNSLHHCEGSVFDSLDKGVEAIFEAVMSYKPRNLAEYRETLLFLINAISRNDDGNNSRLISRLEELINQAVDELRVIGTIKTLS
ncbi:hypothetical protein [Shinella kummerowiae]|uniref:Uncharacterized protein n=1 Tax=Shinella kummerowiae TaxID=417745 RepID=A0A6N8SHF9_9HYPH|nr:hypothetical protein [Shinella kummerowiae]MCT7664012.1 hypothetical protein [Shinella kummerowiae]MXN48505.1 hypothetical protein [Shinella kummerowiae]